MPQKKFIITQDESVSNILLAHGFRLVSHIGNTYTFVNETVELFLENGEKFNFSSIDATKLHFTNILHI